MAGGRRKRGAAERVAVSSVGGYGAEYLANKHGITSDQARALIVRVGGCSRDEAESRAPVKVLKPIALEKQWVTLAAVDDSGDLLIRVDLAVWEEMKERGSDWMDTADRQDLALSFVETRAARVAPVDSPQGRLITLQRRRSRSGGLRRWRCSRCMVTRRATSSSTG
jgi:hypothetical protein